MIKKIALTILFITISFYGIAQKELNNYKYIIVPKKFSFSKSEDQYQLNALTKFLFNKYGYEAYFNDELPEDVKQNRCLALIVDVSNEEGSMFKTMLEIALRDCYGVAVVTSKIGESRLKEYDKAYNVALRSAFETFQNFDYKYVANEETIVERTTEEMKPEENTVQITEKEELVLKDALAKENVMENATKTSSTLNADLYYAQAISNGFQLVNSEPKVVMMLLNTSSEDIFMVKGKNAIVYKKDGKWMYSENNGTSTSEAVLNIKF